MALRELESNGASFLQGDILVGSPVFHGSASPMDMSGSDPMAHGRVPPRAQPCSKAPLAPAPPAAPQPFVQQRDAIGATTSSAANTTPNSLPFQCRVEYWPHCAPQAAGGQQVMYN